ncbi:hypothetical protein ZWY2020_017499 [Hordeum vulgare]|nr:hypothetical protein ZWY2020_017499 [Hordeum vulgare]
MPPPPRSPRAHRLPRVAIAVADASQASSRRPHLTRLEFGGEPSPKEGGGCGGASSARHGRREAEAEEQQEGEEREEGRSRWPSGAASSWRAVVPAAGRCRRRQSSACLHVCDGPMRKKCKLTVLLMGGTNNPIVLPLASLFKLTFSYNKKEDVDSYSYVSKILPIIALKGRFCLLYSQLTE